MKIDVLNEIMQYDCDRVIFTGGEPMLHDLWPPSIAERRGYNLSIESNGTIEIPDGLIDWICISPKDQVYPNSVIRQRSGQELKVVYCGQEMNMYDDLKSDLIITSYNHVTSIQLLLKKMAYCFRILNKLSRIVVGGSHCRHTNGWGFYENRDYALSGGMDSTCLLMHYLARDYRAICISYHYGQKHSIEIERASTTVTLCQGKGLDVQHHIVDLSPAMSLFDSALTSGDQDVPLGHYEEDQMKQTVVPNRNAILHPYCMVLHYLKQRKEERSRFALGVHSGDHAIYPDCRPEFYQALQSAFEIGNWDSEMVELTFPICTVTRHPYSKMLWKLTPQLGFDFDTVLRNTITSYNLMNRDGAQEKADRWNEFWHSMQLIELTQSNINNAGCCVGTRTPVEMDYKGGTDMNLDERIAALTEISYYVTQQNGTEMPFTGALNKEYRPAITIASFAYHLFTSNEI